MAGSEVAVSDDGKSAIERFQAEFGGGVPVGLENVGSDDLSLAIIRIDHEENKFLDSLTGQHYDELDGVILGLLKQRVLWDPDQDSKAPLLCKSRDANVGNPREEFPWEEYRKHGGQEVAGSETIACGSCSLAKWGTHPKNDTPWCSLQYAFPFAFGTDEQVAGLLTVQRSSLKGAQKYISAFVRDAVPLFAFKTKITLNGNRKGTVKYSTPNFIRGEAIEDPALFRAWSDQYTQIKALAGLTDVSGAAVVGESEPAQSPGAPPF